MNLGIAITESMSVTTPIHTAKPTRSYTKGIDRCAKSTRSSFEVAWLETHSLPRQ